MPEPKELSELAEKERGYRVAMCGPGLNSGTEKQNSSYNNNKNKNNNGKSGKNSSKDCAVVDRIVSVSIF